jgi:hypothetical protein
MSIQEKDYLEIYKKQKESELGWGESSAWTNRDFEKLSELIFEKTGIRLSESTLKRVWGKVKYDSAPTVTTLNVLAQFSGFEDWRGFKASNGFQNGNGHHHPIEKINSPRGPVQLLPRKETKRTRGIVILSAVLVVILGLSLSISSRPDKIDLSQVHFDFRIVSNELPNSVVFDYSVGKNKVDSLLIQQSWDPQRRELVSSSKNQHTSIYYYPGYFNAKLIADNAILREKDVFIKTDGWIGIIEQIPVPTYLGKEEINLQENSMAIDQSVLAAKLGKTVFNNVWTNFYKIGNFEPISSDNFEFEITLQNTSTKEESVCQQARVSLVTTKSAIVLPLSSRGCTAAISVFDGENYISGKDTDLSMFGCDFSVPQKLSCKMTSRNLTVSLNDKVIFTISHTSDVGDIVGLSIGFEGAGRISDLTLK